MPHLDHVREHPLDQDVMWVGGGGGAGLLAIWRLHGWDEILHELWQTGIGLTGTSAGSICWHVGGTTDSFGPTLHPVTNGLAFLPQGNARRLGESAPTGPAALPGHKRNSSTQDGVFDS
jgi:peptidase E